MTSAIDAEQGRHRPRYSKRVVREFAIPVPPLPEQQRIVGILDEAFEGIATAKANAEKNLQNARALFESHLQSVFTKRPDEVPLWNSQVKSLMEITCPPESPNGRSDSSRSRT